MDQPGVSGLQNGVLSPSQTVENPPPGSPAEVGGSNAESGRPERRRASHPARGARRPRVGSAPREGLGVFRKRTRESDGIFATNGLCSQLVRVEGQPGRLGPTKRGFEPVADPPKILPRGSGERSGLNIRGARWTGRPAAARHGGVPGGAAVLGRSDRGAGWARPRRPAALETRNGVRCPLPPGAEGMALDRVRGEWGLMVGQRVALQRGRVLSQFG